MKRRWKIAIAGATLIGALVFYAQFDWGRDIRETTLHEISGNEVAFLNADEGSSYLVEATDFSAYNDQLDTALRLESDRTKFSRQQNIKALETLIREQPVDWHVGQLEDFAALLRDARALMDNADVCIWPDDLMMVKTKGKAQFGAYYTTGNAIMIPSGQMKFLFVPPRRNDLARLLAHEIWHVASRNNPDLRNRAYAIFGFEPIPDEAIPHQIRERIIGNPDVEDIAWKVSAGGHDYLLALRSKHHTYEGLKNPVGLLNTLFGYMETVIYPMSQEGMVIDEPEVLDNQLNGTIGTISSYRFGPDEIVAKAFEALLDRASGQSSYKRTPQNERLLDKLALEVSCD